MPRHLKPCPFCGGSAQITKHFREEMWALIHRCEVMGPLQIEWSELERIIARWNTRAGQK